MLEKHSIKQVSLPDDLLMLAENLKGESLDEKLRVSLAINLYFNKLVTLEKAAELSGIALVDFVDLLKKQEIPWGEYTREHKIQDDKVLLEIQEKLSEQ